METYRKLKTCVHHLQHFLWPFSPRSQLNSLWAQTLSVWGSVLERTNEVHHCIKQQLEWKWFTQSGNTLTSFLIVWLMEEKKYHVNKLWEAVGLSLNGQGRWPGSRTSPVSFSQSRHGRWYLEHAFLLFDQGPCLLSKHCGEEGPTLRPGRTLQYKDKVQQFIPKSISG